MWLCMQTEYNTTESRQHSRMLLKFGRGCQRYLSSWNKELTQIDAVKPLQMCVWLTIVYKSAYYGIAFHAAASHDS